MNVLAAEEFWVFPVTKEANLSCGGEALIYLVNCRKKITAHFELGTCK